MSIRKTLLSAFLVVGLLPAILLAVLAFTKARQAVQAEIERNIAVQASSLSADIDKMMFERLQNAVVWSRLDVMQDLLVNDVDKRLSRFLADLQAGYRDVYLELSCVDGSGLIVSSSDAMQVGREAVRTRDWQRIAMSGRQVTLEEPTYTGVGTLVMRVPVSSQFSEGSLGELRMKLDWAEVDHMLDQAAGGSGRMLALLDARGRLIAASNALRRPGMLDGYALAAWRGSAASRPVMLYSGAPLTDADVIVGKAASRGFGQYQGFGWTVLVIQPVDLALAPIHRMSLIFLGLLAAIAVLILFTASWVSREIAKPVQALTSMTRDYMRGKAFSAPPTFGPGEVGELREAFVQMVRNIDQSQENLIRASKLAVVGEMSAIIAHEVRTPLGILRSSAQMLRREPDLGTEAMELIGFIESETERLNRLVSAMLDTARSRTPVYAKVDMQELIRRCIALLAAQTGKKQVKVMASLDASSPVVECDEEQMTQVLLNLLMNGLQILHHGGQIEVSCRNEGSGLVIDIADDGPGIDPAERSRVFEAFFFKREGGVGLGLAIVQQIVHAHRGGIAVAESRLGGALFSIRLPATQSD